MTDPTGRTVLLAGDSTVANYPAIERPMSGWGEHLGGHLNALLNRGRGEHAEPLHIRVANFAKNGANTSSHRGEGLWDALLWTAMPGDVVVIQFGHNDQKLPTLAATGGYRRNLTAMVADCRDRALVPVLCTPVGRRTLGEGVYVSSHGDYPGVVRDLAGQLGVALVDVEALSARIYEAYGPDDSRRLFMHLAPWQHHLWRDGVADDTHFTLRGAGEVALAVASELLVVAGEALGRAGVPAGVRQD